ncbi:hypothetical protein SPRG_17216 [Saprolegnia parasitica CBS 223.65]|uniref:Uncharacterized protein n=1 Tax=Saprolegnia parasitica (strain CBS 223.65) TaxID=695850 RepID=A0A067BRP9_SAPPC|nr:hypothetical protein SPRG_17216 [Saprolegnia parasitica CBS 223.65]KDO17337.1 hypothetical protein SPRG_17216 [Saprolegnia parasitica CBS 223.65]|eukprot:XP_012211956.1 hypothetical protein SPRG_17216 [Saprolegnia parasitica CBS 223.65]
MATTVHTCLHAYGWTTIYPALEAFLERWLTAREASGVSHLVTSLAGIFTGVTALCPPLRQAFVGEFVKMCWQHLLETTTPPMQHWILVDAYLMDTAPQHVRGNWLDVRLPPVLIGMVDGFLYGRSFASALARKQVSASKQLQQLPFGLVQAIASHPTLPQQRYLDVLATSINELVRTSVDVGRETPQAVSSSDLGNIMDALHRLGCINAALLTACRVISSPERVVAGLLLFLQLPAPPLPPSAQLAIAHFAESAAPTFHYTDHTQHDDVLSSFVDVIEVLTLTAPRDVLPFVTAWCAALPETLDATRSSLYPVVEMLYSRLKGKDLDLVVHLAGPCLAALLQGGALTPVPALNDFVLTAIEVDADHCDECAAFGVFLLDGHCMEFRCEYDDGPCKALEELVKAYPLELLLDQVDGSDDSASDSDDERSANFFIWKRAQPGGATIDDLIEYLHRSAQRQGDIARVAVLDEVLALHAAAMDVDAPAPKRPRHET